jgi:carotenoid phi-ring synthase / carotenoid chi-ring synthase
MSRTQIESLVFPNPSGHLKVPRSTRAVVVGGGIAGIAAATVLAERGVRVTLLEREPALGGRAGSFEQRLSTGEHVQMERGFHAFFRQYYTLRALLRRVDPELSMLRELSDYPILGPHGMVQSFRDLPKRAPLNVLALTQRTPYLRLPDLLKANRTAALELLAYDGERTYQRFDRHSAEQFLSSLGLPERARQMLFDVFAHSFFNPESDMSAAELLMMFHCYFMANPEGLIFDVAREPLGVALWSPFERWLAARGVDVRTGVSAERVLRATSGKIAVEHSDGRAEGELLVLALDVRALRELIARSPDLAALASSTDSLVETRPFAVWRLWLDRPVHRERPIFAGTTGMGLLDNISLYDRFQGESAAWSKTHGGAVVELHAYAVPPELDEARVRAELLAGLHAFYPETRGARVLHDSFSLRSDCPAFAPNMHARRPGVATVLPDVALAGDGIRVPVPCALMERAAVSGVLAANVLLAPLGVVSEPIRSVPTQGLLARPRAPIQLPATVTSGPRGRLALLGRRLPPTGPRDPRPDWQQASASWIAGALQHAQQLPSGGWYALDASSAIGATPRCYRVRGQAFVVWRDDSGIVVAPEACPHLGASLAGARVCDGKLICPWHGLELGRAGHRGWKPLPSHDDGVLCWLRMREDGADQRLADAPSLPLRPHDPLAAVIRVEADCEPRDVIANRFDPWHGAHFHPHSFARLHVLEQDERSITVRVAYRLVGSLAVEVDARFACTDARSIAMTIVRGEGAGSVVETHATPIAAGRTAIVEATLASSDRAGFRAARRLAPLLQPFMARAARRLWREDAEYAERLYSLRTRSGALPLRGRVDRPGHAERVEHLSVLVAPRS